MYREDATNPDPPEAVEGLRAEGLGDPDPYRGLTKQVAPHHLDAWRALKAEALRAHDAFVNAARGAAVARHKGDEQRADYLTRLARKQHSRWVDASQQMTSYES